jgi:hypothetical protein
VPGFLDPANGDNANVTDQAEPVLSRDGKRVVFTASPPCCSSFGNAIVETDLAANLANSTSVRMDVGTSDVGLNLGSEESASPSQPAMSADGRTVAFTFGQLFDTTKVYVAKRTGNTVHSVTASLDNNGNPSQGFSPALSGDGRYLAFVTDAFNMHNGLDGATGDACPFRDTGADNRTDCQIVARDLVRDAARLTAGQPRLESQLVSASVHGECTSVIPVGVSCAGDDKSENPSLDATGSEIGFDSLSDDLLAADVPSTSPNGRVESSYVHTWRPTLTGSLNYGAVGVGASLDKNLAVTEHGFGPITIGTTPITGTNAAEFVQQNSACIGVTLNDGQQCAVAIRFTPSALGPRNATVTATTGANGYPRKDPHPVGALTGAGVNGLISVDPSTLDFGNRLPLAPGVTKIVTLTNNGGTPLTVTGGTVHDTTHPGASGDYTVDTSGCASIPAGGTCTISVRFVGHATGRRDASLVLTINSGATTTVGLLANVPKPQVLANPGVTIPGRVTSISGTGFAPNKPVTIVLKGGAESATATADSHGAFEVTLVVFRNTPMGPRDVVAHTDGADKSITGTGPLLVSVGSVDLLQLVSRH